MEKTRLKQEEMET